MTGEAVSRGVSDMVGPGVELVPQPFRTMLGSGQPLFREASAGYVKSSSLQLTLREMRALSRRPRAYLVLGAIGLLMGMVGPFGTFEMPLLPRLAYWLAVVFGTAIIGTFVELWVSRGLLHGLPPLVAATLGGAMAGVPIGLSVFVFNRLVFPPSETAISLSLLLAYCVPIAALVTGFGHLVLSDASPRETAAPAVVPATPALLERLPLPQRGALLHIAVSDHYVDVTTDRGTTLVLMRLSDAIRETAPVEGLRCTARTGWRWRQCGAQHAAMARSCSN